MCVNYIDHYLNKAKHKNKLHNLNFHNYIGAILKKLTFEIFKRATANNIHYNGCISQELIKKEKNVKMVVEKFYSNEILLIVFLVTLRKKNKRNSIKKDQCHTPHHNIYSLLNFYSCN